ncbi:hypothetical protein B0H19DRAFT_1058251 [Mycena capillaripes]|nr:hypothetical protein B0H19DRAFT_1058251 [Mycena capillaripes]
MTEYLVFALKIVHLYTKFQKFHQALFCILHPDPKCKISGLCFEFFTTIYGKSMVKIVVKIEVSPANMHELVVKLFPKKLTTGKEIREIGGPADIGGYASTTGDKGVLTIWADDKTEV